MNDDEFNQALFGRFGATPTSGAYIAALRRLLKTSATHLAKVDGTKRRVFWIDGGSLGWLECRGAHALDATISGQIIQLSAAYVELKVDVDVDRTSGTVESGRVLRISAPHGDRIELDASPKSVPDSEERARVETFMDQVLSAIAGHSVVGASALEG